MKKIIYGISFLALVGAIVVGCQKESLKPNLSSQPSKEVKTSEDNNRIELEAVNQEIIDGLRNSVLYFRDKHENDETYKELSLEEKYMTNLEQINLNLGLGLNYDTDEFHAVLSNLNDNFLENGFLLTEQEYQSQLNIIIENGHYELFLEVQDILNQVYEVDNQRMSWGCGFALAGNFVATLGLTACVTGVACPLAIAAKALSLAGVATSC